MKSVLKRRKHRKGIRPVRKGTLKVNLQVLPAAYQLLTDITAFNKYRNDAAPLYDALEHYNAGNIGAFNWIIIESRRLGHLMDLMMKGHDHLKKYYQIKPVDLALNVINDVDPVYGGPQTMDQICAKCPVNGNCSFKCYTDPEHRFRWCPMGEGAKLLAQKAQPKELSVSEMAELALTHLS